MSCFLIIEPVECTRNVASISQTLPFLVEAEVGSTLVLECPVCTLMETRKVLWYRNDVKIEPTLSSKKLVMHSVNAEEHSGIYKCVLLAGEQRIESTARIVKITGWYI